VKLTSADPFAHPLIDPNYLTTPFDIFTMREAVKAVKRFASADAWKDYIVSAVGGVVGTEDADIDAYVRDQAVSVLHATGTASISPKGASWGVVEPDLKVKGVDGVRIVDASILVGSFVLTVT
jgi:choline dehydrogenase-like flavoprotein